MRSSVRRMVSTTAALAAVIVVAACGGDSAQPAATGATTTTTEATTTSQADGSGLSGSGEGGEEIGSTGPLTREALVEQANDLCADLDEEIEDVFDDVGTQPTGEDAQEAAERIVTRARDFTDILRRLEPPPEDAATVRAYLDAFERATDEIEAAADDPDDAAELFDGRDLFAPARPLADEYGMTVCGSGDPDDQGATATTTSSTTAP